MILNFFLFLIHLCKPREARKQSKHLGTLMVEKVNHKGKFCNGKVAGKRRKRLLGAEDEAALRVQASSLSAQAV